ncbi:NADP-dependent oxidoreductase [Pontibacter mangrovi]|uniref:NADP-dependent oxidoreductase n=1 Tax=Pontibacter mangrovi TaxID=2589816 RepID=A0A501WKV1_9BACT|nr:NADP-dependent oxidoreductase [Pontibacter mangrovi]TPE46276.1 NADP-dependent oxidoreductase [Pontibacter mangrovi]
MAKQMRAAVYNTFGGPENVHVQTIDVPEPGEGEVMVRIKAAGVNPVDYAVREGYLKDFLPTQFPVIPGWDVAGEIVERGYSARRFNVGEQVYAYARRPVVQYGTFAEYIVLPESYLTGRPLNVSWEEAAGIPLVGLTAFQSLFDAGQLQDRQSVLILGASGGVGSMAIQLAKVKGATVVGVASAQNHAYMRNLGADYTITYKDTHVGEAVKQLLPGGVDLIFDCASGETLMQSLQALKPNGKLVSILNHGTDLDPSIDFSYVFVEPNTRQLDILRELTEAGQLHVPVSKKYTLDETVEAMKQIQTQHTTGKIVITP